MRWVLSWDGGNKLPCLQHVSVNPCLLHDLVQAKRRNRRRCIIRRRDRYWMGNAALSNILIVKEHGMTWIV